MNIKDPSFTYHSVGTFYLKSMQRFNRLPTRRKSLGHFEIKLSTGIQTCERIICHVWYNNAWVLPSAVPMEKL